MQPRLLASMGSTLSACSEVTQQITVTLEHPFWELTGEAWTPAGDLRPGDRLLQRDGDLLTVTGIIALDRTASFTVYNFTVADTHNYYATPSTPSSTTAVSLRVRLMNTLTSMRCGLTVRAGHAYAGYARVRHCGHR